MESNNPQVKGEGDLERLLAGLPKEKQEEIRGLVAMRRETESFHGPIPHPRHFAHYEEVHKGSADRILRMAEEEQKDRIRDNRLQGLLSLQGLWLGTLIILVLIASAIYAMYLGYSYVATLIIAPIVGIAVIFILRLKPNVNE